MLENAVEIKKMSSFFDGISQEALLVLLEIIGKWVLTSLNWRHWRQQMRILKSIQMIVRYKIAIALK